jgi:hypothetical protein
MKGLSILAQTGAPLVPVGTIYIPEHVVWWNLTTYEVIYIVLIAVQTLLVYWYAKEAKAQRQQAARQAAAIERQCVALNSQNDLVAAQLVLSREALEMQREEREQDRKDREHEQTARTRQEESKDAEMEPLFRLTPISNTNGELVMLVSNPKKNASIEELRCNVLFLNRQMATNDSHSFMFAVQNHVAVFYFGIRYRRLADGKENTQVFEVSTGNGAASRTDKVPFANLPVNR